MKYLCLDCKKTFQHAAKETAFSYDEICAVPVVSNQVESYVCPFCLDHHIEETQPTPVQTTTPESVYIYEFTAERIRQGLQTELNGLLAEGYKPSEKYAKYWILEKPKTKPLPEPKAVPQDEAAVEPDVDKCSDCVSSQSSSLDSCCVECIDSSNFKPLTPEAV